MRELWIPGSPAGSIRPMVLGLAALAASIQPVLAGAPPGGDRLEMTFAPVGGDTLEVEVEPSGVPRGGAWTPQQELFFHAWEALSMDLVRKGASPLLPLFGRPGIPGATIVIGEETPLSPPAGWFKIELQGLSSPRRAALVDWTFKNLGRLPGFRQAYVTPEVTPPFSLTIPVSSGDDACPIKTPRYDPLQAYLGPAPAGIDAPAAWVLPGGRGEAIWFADIEGAWNVRHEDLPGDRMKNVSGRVIPDRGWEAHGTAVLGVVASRENELGMIGITPMVDRILTGSIGGSNPAQAIHETASRLRPGDVLLIELHGPGPRSRYGGGQRGYVPMEWWDAVFDVIRMHTSRGIIIVEAAGNGAENLDDPIYQGKFDRTRRDSGAIMIGAGAPAAAGYTDRSRLDFSNHGSRVDLQGWGRQVATLDYGDLQGCAEATRKYTALFAGTSSASPVVAGAIVALQSIYKARTGRVLDGARIRDLLVRTGSPQTDGPHGPRTQHIGPRPDLRRALSEVDYRGSSQR